MPEMARDPRLRPTRAPALAARAERHRRAGRGVVAIQGLGFVGTAVAAAVAAVRDPSGDEARYFVIGVDLPSVDGRRKIARVNAGRPAVDSPDAELAAVLARAVRRDENLCATTSATAFALADTILVAVPLDARRDAAGACTVDERGFVAGLRSIGRHMQADALVVIETTVPIGTCEGIARRVLEEERARRGIAAPLRLAHAYERVTPGRSHLTSVRHCRRVYSASDAATAARAEAFLSTVIDVARFPLQRLADPASSELAKLLENSYRAVTIALMQEWALLAERAGVNLYAVVDVIRGRVGTHDNMRYPGFGVGGYCLPKDALLAQWAARHTYGLDAALELSLHALEVNRAMPLHALDLARELCGGSLAGRAITLCGVSYLPELDDTRNSPAEAFVDAAITEGALVRAHDPHVGTWTERPDVPMVPALDEALAGADAVVFAVAHPAYRAPSIEGMLATAAPLAVVDANDVLTDATAAALHGVGCRIAGVGKGHWRKEGYQWTT